MQNWCGERVRQCLFLGGLYFHDGMEFDQVEATLNLA